MRIYTETPLRMVPPRSMVIHPEIATASSTLEVQRREHDRDVAYMRACLERRLLPLFWRQVLENVATVKARTEAMRPSIGKPLTRRARRRKRGRVRAAKAALIRRFTPSVEWAWNKRDAA